MSGLRPLLGFLVVFPVVSSAPAFAADEVGDAFAEGLAMLSRDRDAEALHAFRRVLSLDPSGERMLELWQQDEDRQVTSLLTMGGEFEQVGKALLTILRAGKREFRDDATRIRELLRIRVSGDVAARRDALYRLSFDHGEFAVPYALPMLADQSNDERRVDIIATLVELGSKVVPPLTAALSSDDGFLRRQVATTLGLIGDRRAGPALAHLAESDPQSQVAARDALARLGVSDNAATLFRSLGHAYLIGASEVLAPEKLSDVVWSWGDGGLESTAVPGFLYGARLAQDAYFRSLDLGGASLESRAGVALASAAVSARISMGGDSDWDEAGTAAELAVAVSGPDAADQALHMALAIGDHGAAIVLARSLGDTARNTTGGLQAALAQRENAGLRGESAASLAAIAVRSGVAASGEVISALGEAAARQVLRIAVVIDADAARASSTRSSLESMGIGSVHTYGSGTQASVDLGRLPGVDIVLLADSLPDLTTDEVLDSIRNRESTADVPVLILTGDADAADELYGDKSQGTVTAEAELSQVPELMAEVDGDRARAEELARRATQALARLATSASTNLSGVADHLAAALEGSDAKVGPALAALGACGTARHADQVAAVVADSNRNVEVRTAAAMCLGGIFDREPAASDEVLSALREAGDSGESIGLRRAALAALGRLDLSAEARSELLDALRSA